MSLCIVNIGKTKSGKTTRTVKIAKSMPAKGIIVNDIQYEQKYRSDNSIRKFYGDSKDYLKLLSKKDLRNNYTLRDHVVIIEDAVSLLPHGGGLGDIQGVIAAKRFTHNIFILNFHALRQVPEYIMDYVDVMYIGKSRGNTGKLYSKFENYPEIITTWNYVNMSKNPYEFREVWL